MRNLREEDCTKPIMELLKAVGKLAVEEGEQWRLAHPELMDTYEACVNEIFSICDK